MNVQQINPSNGGWTTRCAKDEYHSRVVEYKLEGNTATLVWEFPGSFSVPDAWYNDWYSPYWGLRIQHISLPKQRRS